MRAENQMTKHILKQPDKAGAKGGVGGNPCAQVKIGYRFPLCLAENITPDFSANQILRRESIEPITSRSNHMKLVPRAGKTVRECHDCLPIHF